MANGKLRIVQKRKNLKNLGEKMKFFYETYLENINKWLILITLVFSFSAQAVEDETFLVILNKCVINQIDMLKAEDLKVLTHPPLNLVCSRGDLGKIKCKVMEKEGSVSTLVDEKEYRLHLALGDISELKGEGEHYNLVFINRKQKKAFYQSTKMESQTLAKQVVCSGVYKDAQDIKKMIQPATPPRPKPKPQEITPAMIGE